MGEFSLTAIVRPFGGTVSGETPFRAPSFSQVPLVDAEQENRNLVIIKGGAAQVITLSHSSDSTVSKQVVKEVKRTYDEVRIKNPDDESQHVDVKRPRKIETAPEKTGVPHGGSSMITKYAKQPETSTIEVLTRNNEEKNPDYGSGGGAAP
jgi:hypothetical protein